MGHVVPHVEILACNVHVSMQTAVSVGWGAFAEKTKKGYQ